MTTLSDDLLHALAREAGFSAAGIAAVPEPDSAEDREERERFTAWIEAGRGGEMDYLKRRDDAGRLLRSSVRLALPWARSVMVCAANYNSGEPRSIDPAPEGTGWIARYAWTSRIENGPAGAENVRPSDYHKVLRRRLEKLRERLAHEVGAFESRCFVDTGPVVERVYARYAGIGWVGKNTCILNEKLGSWLFLGVIVTSLEVANGESAALAADRCGSCTRCIDACPTGALTGEREMDASRCIAYLTIEKRGPIPTELRAGIGRQVFGCDICQDVCPWNNRPTVQRGSAAPARGMETRQELINPPLEMLASMDNGSFKRWFKGSPLERTGRKRLQRNVAIAMGNSGEQELRPKLAVWAEDDDAVLAEAARWALERLDRELIADR